jgi:L-fuconolactonase
VIPVRIVDSQVHVWRTVLPGREPHLGRAAFLATDLVRLMADAGVDRAVLVPPPWDPDANAEALDAVRRWPELFRVMGHFEVEREADDRRLATWLDQPGMVGLRLAFRVEHAAVRLIDGTTDWLWEAASDARVPVMLYPPGRLSLISEIARAFPSLRLAVDHMALHHATRGRALAHDLRQLCAMAALPNVVVKLSALPLYSDEPFPYADTRHLVETVVRAFGPERCFWGSDLTRLPCTYQQAVDMMTDLGSSLSRGDMRLVMGDSIMAWLAWD